MELRMFEFIKKVTDYMDENECALEEISDYMKKYFDDKLRKNNEGYLNINGRVKSISSLKEKILRNSYYKDYEEVEEFLNNLHDLIGIRIECRFIEDEKHIYNALKDIFTKTEDGLYYVSRDDENLVLEMGSVQPQVQKNGFSIYRIDGYYLLHGHRINFELQIKSLVNVFWGEIEHKVIYKNNHYTMDDIYVKQMLASIKTNLAMIDNQLLIIDNQYNKFNAIDPSARRHQLEKVLSKITYEVFAMKMKDSIGFNVDFKKSCDSIVDYMVRTTAMVGDDETETILRIITRINEIGKLPVDFSKEIKFERDIELNGRFSKIIGTKMKELINEDFQWYIFFRILFEIEKGNNAEDFEAFMKFLKNRFLGNEVFSKLYYTLNEDDSNEIQDAILEIIAEQFEKTGNISFIYEETISSINISVKNIIELICQAGGRISADEKAVYMRILKYNIETIFGNKVELNSIVGLVKDIKKTIPESIRRNYSLEYINEILGMKNPKYKG